MGKTLKVIKDRRTQKAKQVLPIEIAQGIYIRRMPSLDALKLFYVLIENAGINFNNLERYKIDLSNALINLSNYTTKDIQNMLYELMGTVLETVTITETFESVTIGGLLDIATVKKDKLDNIHYVEWSFNSLFSEVFRKSNYWVLLEKKAMYGFKSKYSLQLYQHLNSLVNLNHVKSKSFNIEEFRKLFGLGDNKLKLFADLKKIVINPAIKEINSLTEIKLSVEYKKKRRAVKEIIFYWEIQEQNNKQTPQQIVQEVTQSLTIAPTKPFPNNGSIEYDSYWMSLKRQTDCNLDNYLLANEFRDFCLSKNIPMNAKNIAQTFIGFCKKIGRV